eukprot:5218108-Pleurochrysis_carterae.AAC.3
MQLTRLPTQNHGQRMMWRDGGGRAATTQASPIGAYSERWRETSSRQPRMPETACLFLLLGPDSLVVVTGDATKFAGLRCRELVR